MVRFFLFLAAILAGLAVAGGALGAHALKASLSGDQLGTFETAVRYQLVHALALGLVAWVCDRFGGRFATAAGWFFFVGIALFSGSLYGLVFDGPRWLGPVTPLGGISLMIGWSCLAIVAWRRPRVAHRS